jgi:hypothetical protein
VSTPVAAELVSAEMAAAAAPSGAVGVPITLILYLVAQELSERTEVLVAAVAGELMAAAVVEATVVAAVADRTWTRHSPAPARRAKKTAATVCRHHAHIRVHSRTGFCTSVRYRDRRIRIDPAPKAGLQN